MIRRLRVPAAVAIAIATAIAMWAGPSAIASEALRDHFESGAALNWSETSHVVVSKTSAKTGAYGARTKASSGKASYLAWYAPRVTPGMRYARIRGWVRVESAPAGQSVDVFTVENAERKHNFDFFRSPRGKWKYDLLAADSALATAPSSLGTWYYVEALVDFGGVGGQMYHADVWIDGVKQPTITSTGQVGSTVRAAYFGATNDKKTATRDYDDLALDVGHSPFAHVRPSDKTGAGASSPSTRLPASKERASRQTALVISGSTAALLLILVGIGVKRRRSRA